MKQGKAISGLVTTIIVIAVMGYMAYYIFRAVDSPLKTVEAVLYTAEESVTVNGYLFRNETLLAAEGSGVQEIVAREGEKVAKGQVLVMNYENTSVRDSQKVIEKIDKDILLLQAAVNGQNASNVTKTDRDIAVSLNNFLYGIEMPKTIDVAAEGEELKSLILKRGITFSDSGSAEAKSEMDRLAAQRADILNSTGKGFVSLYAPISGLFSGSVDGFEEVLNLEKSKTITVSELMNVDSQRRDLSGENYCGRLVSGFEWRYAAVVPTEHIKDLSPGNSITLRFVGDYIGSLRARIRRVEVGPDGNSLIVLSSDKHVSELLGLRRQNVDIVFSTYEGVRIPKQALRIDENGNTGVYCLVAMQAVFVKTEQIFETDQHYIVKYDPTSLSNLRPGDEIIVTSKNLFDGKRVK